MIARRSSLRLAWLLASLVASACSTRADVTEPIDSGDVTEVVIRDFAFSAPTITIDRGTSVRWRNTTGTFHTVTPDGHQAFGARQTATRGQTFDTRFDTPGRYVYYCEPHRSLGMTGEIVVR
jgi:plastocyanin